MKVSFVHGNPCIAKLLFRVGQSKRKRRDFRDKWGYSLEHKQVVSGILRVQRNGISCLILSNSRIEILIGFAAWSHVGLNDGLNNNQFYEWWKRMEIHFNFVNDIEKCQLFMIAVYCVFSYFCIWKYWKDLLVFSFFFLCL